MEKLEHLRTFIEFYPTHWNNKPFMLPSGWSSKVADDVIREIKRLYPKIEDTLSPEYK